MGRSVCFMQQMHISILKNLTRVKRNCYQLKRSVEHLTNFRLQGYRSAHNLPLPFGSLIFRRLQTYSSAWNKKSTSMEDVEREDTDGTDSSKKRFEISGILKWASTKGTLQHWKGGDGKRLGIHEEYNWIVLSKVSPKMVGKGRWDWDGLLEMGEEERMGLLFWSVERLVILERDWEDDRCVEEGAPFTSSLVCLSRWVGCVFA